jgi:hypothetical protein
MTVATRSPRIAYANVTADKDRPSSGQQQLCPVWPGSSFGEQAMAVDDGGGEVDQFAVIDA